ncbi:MAG TPA: ABC transporter permease [Bordetella sp.]
MAGFFSLDGYGRLLLEGTWATIELGVLSLVVAFLLGLLGASAKLSRSRLLRAVATAYTTLIRAVPDLVLMLLLFYGIQIGLNHVTESLGLQQMDIPPFLAGVITLGFIYGAYYTETLRGAFLAVPRGQIEAGYAYGMSGWRVFRDILFPQMMRFALPGIGNNWLVVVKASAIVTILGLDDLVKAAIDASQGTQRAFFFLVLAAGIFLAITTVSSLVLAWAEKRYSLGVRESEL